MTEDQQLGGKTEKIDVAVGSLLNGGVFEPEGPLNIDGERLKVDEIFERRSPKEGKALSRVKIGLGPVAINHLQDTVAAELRVDAEQGPDRDRVSHDRNERQHQP